MVACLNDGPRLVGAQRLSYRGEALGEVVGVEQQLLAATATPHRTAPAASSAAGTGARRTGAAGTA